jgi:endonuclease YncB( thermonuclease family)
MKEHLYYYRVVGIVSIFDGDSLTVQISLGRHLKDRWTLRLARINTPELRDADPALKAKAYEARDYLRGRLEAAMAAGADVIIHSVKLEKYGRALSELFVDGVNINDELVQKGYAVTYGD